LRTCLIDLEPPFFLDFTKVLIGNSLYELVDGRQIRAVSLPEM
jgi:hypothetical protein